MEGGFIEIGPVVEVRDKKSKSAIIDHGEKFQLLISV